MQDTKFECKKGWDFQIYFTGISTHLQTNNLKPLFVNFGYALCSSVFFGNWSAVMGSNRDRPELFSVLIFTTL